MLVETPCSDVHTFLPEVGAPFLSYLYILSPPTKDVASGQGSVLVWAHQTLSLSTSTDRTSSLARSFEIIHHPLEKRKPRVASLGVCSKEE
jgi:hypothetical protein